MEEHIISRVCISTIPTEFGGGIIREVSLLAENLSRAGVEVFVLSPNNLIPGLFFNESIEAFGGIPKEGVVRARTFFPIYCLTHLFNGLLMKGRVPEADVYLTIGSSSLESVPYVFSGKRFVCLAATTVSDEWRSVRKLGDLSRPFSWLLRVVNSVTLPLTRLLEGICYRRAEKVLAISEKTKRCVEEEFSIDDIGIVHPWIPDNAFEEKEREVEGPYLVSIGRLDPRKDLSTLVHAFADSGYEGKLVIAGTGPEEKALRGLVADRNLDSRVEFAGYVDEDRKYSLLQHADAFLLTSTQEGFGITILEAMASRTPVIATRCGGPEEIVADGESGYLVAVGDVTAFSEAIDSISEGNRDVLLDKAFEIAKEHRVSEMSQRLLRAVRTEQI